MAEPRGELELVRRLRELLAPADRTAAAGPPVADSPLPFGDDMAAVDVAHPDLLWTVDTLMDGVDFDSQKHDWCAIGRKALAVNLSDCAAMAATPVAALCALTLNNALTMENAVDLVRGAQELGVRHGCPIVGGDTNSWDAPTVVSITVAARALPNLTPVRRDGAAPGDSIWVTGRVGGSILGRHMTFEPRIAIAHEIAHRLRPHAMIDISDGLALDLSRLLEASRCGATLVEAQLDAAIHPDAVRLAARDGQPAREHALYDGEDFELIVAIPGDVPAAKCAQLGLLPLGEITAVPGLQIRQAGGASAPLAVRGWEHFR